MLRKIKFKEFKDLYRKHIVKDFPSSERPNLEGFRKRMLKYNEETYIYEEDGVERGYCIIDQIQEYVLVAFLAVYEGNRGKGIGTKILKELEEKYSNKKGILLEVEDPNFAKNENEKSIQERRIRFYERANFKVVENLKVELFMVNFNIMIRNITSASTEISEVEKVMKQFYYTIIDKKRLKYINIKTI
mgnify:FL=1